jgi:hypothetical protein
MILHLTAGSASAVRHSGHFMSATVKKPEQATDWTR